VGAMEDGERRLIASDGHFLVLFAKISGMALLR